MKQKDITLFRRNNIGFIVQNFALINVLKVFDNIVLPIGYSGKIGKDTKDKIYKLINHLDIKGKENKYPNQLSGGEAQRVAIARALISDPELILADEPTGSVDNENQQIILDIFREINEQGKTILIVTHDYEFAKTCDRIVEILDN